MFDIYTELIIHFNNLSEFNTIKLSSTTYDIDNICSNNNIIDVIEHPYFYNDLEETNIFENFIANCIPKNIQHVIFTNKNWISDYYQNKYGIIVQKSYINDQKFDNISVIYFNQKIILRKIGQEIS